MVGVDDRRPLWVWENEGGGSDGKPKRSLPGPPRRPPPRPQDTPEGCFAMAAADMARAAWHPNGWARTRLEHSAVMWSRRAKLLREAEGEPGTGSQPDPPTA